MRRVLLIVGEPQFGEIGKKGEILQRAQVAVNNLEDCNTIECLEQASSFKLDLLEGLSD